MNVARDTDEVVRNLKCLRRYAQALIGSQEAGDLYVRVSLEALLAESDLLLAGGSVHLGIFRLSHQVWRRIRNGPGRDWQPPRDRLGRRPTTGPGRRRCRGKCCGPREDESKSLGAEDLDTPSIHKSSGLVFVVISGPQRDSRGCPVQRNPRAPESCRL